MSGALTDTSIVAGASNPTGYTIDQSVRFEKGSKLTKTLASDGNKTTWTWSGWTKNAFDWSSTADNTLFSAIHPSGATSGRFNAYFRGQLPSTYFEVSEYAGSYTTQLATTALYRDPGAWLHVVVVWDTDNGTEADRLRYYINGERVTAFNSSYTNYPSSGEASSINDDAKTQAVGAIDGDTTTSIDSYLAEVHFIDGQALTAASFGEANEDTNQWTAIKYAGTYGTKGYYLKFEDADDFGNDSSGNGNDYTSAGLTASDQMLDTPTNNFATFNPIVTGGWGNPTYEEGNLETSGTNSEYACAAATFAVSDGKWYWELYAENVYIGGSTNSKVGIKSVAAMSKLGRYPNSDTVGTLYYNGWDGSKDIDNTATSYGASYTNGDIIGIALDLDSGTQTIEFYKNNTSQGSITLSGGVAATTVVPMLINLYSAAIELFNFGQDSSFAGNVTAQGNADGNGIGDFYYAVPANHLALCTSNLSDPSIALPGDYFNTVLWTGTGSSNAITGVGFQPDFTWIKNRGSGRSHAWYDAVRGVTKQLSSDNNEIEKTETEGLKSFDSDGFTVGTENAVNESSDGMVSWNWLAGGGAGSSNTDGATATTSTSVNVTAGFSISTIPTYSGSTTFGHGLSVVPELIIVKPRDGVDVWFVGSNNLSTTDWTKALTLNTTAAEATNGVYWNNTAPTASVVSLGTQGNSYTKIMYCFHSVEGYSKVGSYTGNGNVDGPFIYLGFRPAWVMTKKYSATSGNWFMVDNKRDPENALDGWRLMANLSQADSQVGAAYCDFDFCSNGFKNRQDGTSTNTSSAGYIYVAFAKSPFKTSNARS